MTTTTNYDYTKEVPTVLAEYSTDGTIIKYTYGDNDEKINATIKNNLASDYVTPKTFTIENDIRGSVRLVKDSQGETAAKAEYNAWGEVIEETGIYLSANAGTLMFAASYRGYSYERDLEWWNAGARMYDPSGKSFQSPEQEHQSMRSRQYRQEAGTIVSLECMCRGKP